MAYRRRSTRRRSTRYTPRRRAMTGRGRYRGRTRPAAREIRIVLQTPTDMLPSRPTANQFARTMIRRRF